MDFNRIDISRPSHEWIAYSRRDPVLTYLKRTAERLANWGSRPAVHSRYYPRTPGCASTTTTRNHGKSIFVELQEAMLMEHLRDLCQSLRAIRRLTLTTGLSGDFCRPSKNASTTLYLTMSRLARHRLHGMICIFLQIRISEELCLATLLRLAISTRVRPCSYAGAVRR